MVPDKKSDMIVGRSISGVYVDIWFISPKNSLSVVWKGHMAQRIRLESASAGYHLEIAGSMTGNINK